MELLKKFNISIIFMKISIPLFFIMNSEINNKIDYSHTKKLQYIQVIKKKKKTSTNCVKVENGTIFCHV